MPITFIPFQEIKEVFESKANEIAAIIASLPCKPVLVQMPELLPIMTGLKWKKKQIISHYLIRIYIAALFYINSLPNQDHALFRQIKEQLQNDQQKCYDSENFLLNYINAYERALIKYLHLFKVGTDVSFEKNEKGEPPLTYFILNMTQDTIHELIFHELITTQICIPKDDKNLSNYTNDLEELQQKLQLDLTI